MVQHVYNASLSELLQYTEVVREGIHFRADMHHFKIMKVINVVTTDISSKSNKTLI